MKLSEYDELRRAFGPVLDSATDRAIELLGAARLHANARHHAYLSGEHILLALAKANPGVERVTLERLGVDLAAKLSDLEAEIASLSPAAEARDVAGNEITQQLLQRATEAAKSLHHIYLGTEHLVLALLMPGSDENAFLSRHEITLDRFREELGRVLEVGFQ